VELNGTASCQLGLNHALELGMIFGTNREAALPGGHNRFKLFKDKMWGKCRIFGRVDDFTDNLQQFKWIKRFMDVVEAFVGGLEVCPGAWWCSNKR
jgi:hypothetical protein